MIAPQAKPSNDSRSLIFRWSPLHTLTAAKCVDEHDRVIQQLYCLLLDCGRRSNLHNNGRLRGIFEALSIRRKVVMDFIDSHRKLYGRVDSDRIEELVNLVSRLDQALVTAKKVHQSSLKEIASLATPSEAKGGSVPQQKTVSDRSTAGCSAPQTPSRISTPRTGRQKSSTVVATPRRSVLDAAAGSTVPLVRSSTHRGDDGLCGVTQRRSVHGIVIPLLQGIGSHRGASSGASPDTFLRFMSPVKVPTIAGEENDSLGADDDDDDDFDEGDAEVDREMWLSRKRSPSKGRGGSGNVKTEHNSRISDVAPSSGCSPRPSHQKQIGVLFASSTRHAPASPRPLASSDTPRMRHLHGAPVGLLFTTAAQERENFFRVEFFARRHNVEDPEASAFAGLAAGVEQELKILRERALKEQALLRALQLQLPTGPTSQETSRNDPPYPTAAIPRGDPRLSGAEEAATTCRNSFPATRADAPALQSARPTDLQQSPRAADGRSPACFERMLRWRRQLGKGWLSMMVYSVLVVLAASVLFLVDDFIDQYRL